MRIIRTRLLGWMAAGLAACFATGVNAQAVEEVNYLLPAPPFLSAFAPWVLAQQRGYYAKEGLKVTFQVGKGGVDVAKQVGAGNAPIGGAIGDTTIITRAQGVPVKSVALVGGRALNHLFLMEGTGVNSPADLKGKTVTVMSYQDTSYYVLLGILASVGLTKNDVDIQAAGPTGVWQLALAGKSVGFVGSIDWGMTTRAAGGKVRYVASDQFVPSMSQAIVASDEMIQKRPDLIRKLVRATLHGLQDIMRDPSGCVADYIAGNPTFKGKEAYIEEAFKQYNEYTYKGSGNVAAMDPGRLAAVQELYVKLGVVPKASPLKDLYTNQFVE